MKDKEIESAFPHEAVYDFKGDKIVIASPGMSLRDWFAGMALQGLLASIAPVQGTDKNGLLKGTAIRCYEYADAMVTIHRDY